MDYNDFNGNKFSLKELASQHLKKMKKHESSKDEAKQIEKLGKNKVKTKIVAKNAKKIGKK